MKKFTGNKVEAHGIKGMNRTVWQRSFKSVEALNKWAEANDAEVHGTRDTDEWESFQKIAASHDQK